MSETVLDWLIARYPAAKRQTLRRMVEQRRVHLNGRPVVSLKQPLTEGDTLAVNDRVSPAREPPGRLSRQPARGAQRPSRGRDIRPAGLPFAVIYEDDDVLVIDKPAGLLTSTVPREPRPTALAIVRAELAAREPRARIGLIHRLDRDASGLLVFSKNDLAYRSLKRQFFRHTVDRVYLAVVRGTLHPPAGRIESRLVELPDGTVRTSHRPRAGERAITDYQTVRTDPPAGISLVRVTLQTGRKHQIRAHLSERGTPILGDPAYGAAPAAAEGARQPPKASRLMLAAVELAFDHPRTGERRRFNLPPPREMAMLWRGEKR